MLADAGAQLRRQLDAANAMNEAAQEAALEMNEAANQHLTELQLVAEDAVALAREREVCPALEIPGFRRRVHAGSDAFTLAVSRPKLKSCASKWRSWKRSVPCQ